MNAYQIKRFRELREEITRFLLKYKFALDEMETKVEILKEEFEALHDYSPFEHSKSRLKTPESIMKKMLRKGCPLSIPDIEEKIKDIAGMRITCSFISDIYRVREMLEKQSDLAVLEVKDYIERPKPNGYRSLHLIVEVPVFLSDRVEHVCVEVQIRTIAMDFWASLEHKIYYKYNKSVPEQIVKELKHAADTAQELDQQMESLMRKVQTIKDVQADQEPEQPQSITISNQQILLPPALLKLLDGH